MEFCDKCGSRMTRTREGFVCPKCSDNVLAKSKMQLKKEKRRSDSDCIYVSDSSKNNYSKVSRQCPKCGNKEAFRWFSGISGEHAGIRQERTIEHLRCTRCAHTWAEES
jgi:DNA-directed RNA polymerase subunit M/transcription elongation factor TFIIS